jgi:hypothetical protein
MGSRVAAAATRAATRAATPAARRLPGPGWLTLTPAVLTLALLHGAMLSTVALAAESFMLDRFVRKINLSAYVTRTNGLAPICLPPKRVLSMNVRYGDIDGDRSEDVVFEAVTCKSKDGHPDVSGVFTYQHPDSLREFPIEDTQQVRELLSDPRSGPPRLELIDGRVTRWVTIDAQRCKSGGTPARRLVIYRWSGKALAVDRFEDQKARGC